MRGKKPFGFNHAGVNISLILFFNVCPFNNQEEGVLYDRRS
jgi:hypothetical protein